MRKPGLRTNARYRLARWTAWALIAVFAVVEALCDLWAFCTDQAVTEPSYQMGTPSNATRRERLETWVSPARPARMVSAYLRTITPHRARPAVSPRRAW